MGCVATGCVHSQSDPPTLSQAASPQASALALLQSGWNMGFPCGSVVKNLPANVGDADSIPGSGKSPGKGNGNPLQYSCLGNPLGRGAWCATVHGVTKSQTRLSNWAWNACLVMMVVKYCVAYFTVVKRVDLKSSHHKKKNVLKLCTVVDVNYTYCDDHFTIYANIKSFCCTPETSICPSHLNL